MSSSRAPTASAKPQTSTSTKPLPPKIHPPKPPSNYANSRLTKPNIPSSPKKSPNSSSRALAARKFPLSRQNTNIWFQFCRTYIASASKSLTLSAKTSLTTPKSRLYLNSPSFLPPSPKIRATPIRIGSAFCHCRAGKFRPTKSSPSRKPPAPTNAASSKSFSPARPTLTKLPALSFPSSPPKSTASQPNTSLPKLATASMPKKTITTITASSTHCAT